MSLIPTYQDSLKEDVGVSAQSCAKQLEALVTKKTIKPLMS